MTPAIGATQEVMEYVNQLKLDEEALTENILEDKDIFGEDPLLIYKNYDIIMHFLRIFMVISLLLFFVFEGLNWVWTVHLPHKKKFKTIFRSMLNFIILTLIYFSAIVIAILPLRSILSSSSLSTLSLIFSIGLVSLLVYFMIISFSLVNNKNVIIILKKAFLIGTFKAYLVLPTLVIGIIMIVIASFILYNLVDSGLFLMTASIFLFVLTYIFARILVVRLVHRIDE
jgi:hypothetical protein